MPVANIVVQARTKIRDFHLPYFTARGWMYIVWIAFIVGLMVGAMADW